MYRRQWFTMHIFMYVFVHVHVHVHCDAIAAMKNAIHHGWMIKCCSFSAICIAFIRFSFTAKSSWYNRNAIDKWKWHTVRSRCYPYLLPHFFSFWQCWREFCHFPEAPQSRTREGRKKTMKWQALFTPRKINANAIGQFLGFYSYSHNLRTLPLH